MMDKIIALLKQFDLVELQKRLAPILSEQSYVGDLVLALTNLISIEEHFAFTGVKTEKTSYYDLIENIRVMVRKLFEILKVTEELSVVGRDLLAASMRLMEVGTKQWSFNEQAMAQDFFQRAYELQILFYSVTCNLVPQAELKSFNPEAFQALQQYLAGFTFGDFKPSPATKTKAAEAAHKIIPFKNLNEFVEKVDSLKKQNRLDLSSDQDLVLGIMNLVNLEEDFFLLGARLRNKDYYDLLFKVREMRKTLLQTVIQHYEGEVWCISKHLLSASMRLMQAGFKLIEQKKSQLSYELFQVAYDLYSLFWGLNLGVIGKSSNHKPKSFLEKLGSLVKKAIDCCIE